MEIGGRYIAVHVCKTSIMLADCERLKLSTPESHLFWSVKQYLLGKKSILKTTQKWTVTLIRAKKTLLLNLLQVSGFCKCIRNMAVVLVLPNAA